MYSSAEKEYVWKALFAEALGTATLVGSVTVIMNKYCDTQAGMIAAALVCGAIVAAVIYALGQYSGGHANPAVTLGFAAAGRMNWGLALGYIIAQFLGAIIAILAASYALGGYEGIPDQVTGSLFCKDNVKLVCVVALMTLFFVGTFLFVTKNPFIASAGGLAIGLVFALTTLGSYSQSGFSMNVAYSTTAKGDWKRKWLIILGAVIGSVLAGLLQRMFCYRGNVTEAVDCNGKRLVNDCGEKLNKVTHEILDGCGKPVMASCGKKAEVKSTFEVATRTSHHQQTVLSAAADQVTRKTGMKPQQAYNAVIDRTEALTTRLFK